MPGHGFGYGYGAVGYARRNPRLRGGAGTPTPSTGPALPAAGQIVGHFDASAITPQPDNSGLARWDDSSGSGAHATQETAARQPRYRAAGGAGIHGRPYVECDGIDDFLAIATPGALKAALDGRDYTIMVVVDNVGTGGGTFGNIFGATAGGDGLSVMANTSASGQSGGTGLGQVPEGGTGYRSFGFGSSNSNSFGGSGGVKLRRLFYRGTVYSSMATTGIATGDRTIAIGAGNVDVSPTFFFKGNIYRIVIWSTLLTPAEALQAESYFNWFYNQVHPAVTLGRFLHIDGDSRLAAVGATGTTLANAVHYRIAQGLSFPPGTYGVYAVGGLSIQKCIDKGGEIDAVAQALSTLAPTIQHRLIYEEFFNSRALSVGTLTSQTRTYVADRRAAFPPGLKIAGCSPVDHADANTPAASAWATAIEANWAEMGFDGIAKLWSETALGGDEACPNSAPFAPWSDGVHLSNAGQATQADKIVVDCLAMNGW